MVEWRVANNSKLKYQLDSIFNFLCVLSTERSKHVDQTSTIIALVLLLCYRSARTLYLYNAW